ncbi:dihydrofolate reductase [Kribbella amoyensis]|uniref:Dihydrofolate reductase n=1 Tax=Kribbella amoyensis TaxID=996641 RepID=A0A561BJW3_9ACTN|nr:dihydrofolate reductase family protein [Kribbella amoyensis]TWD79130.1 dihydrofolate reductase [Kribbella amoyensis]
MAKLLYSVTMSLDGYIAGPGGDMSWMTEFFAPNPMIGELIPDIGALLVGRTTYDGDDPHKDDEGAGKAFGGGWEGPQYVVTHRVPEQAPDGVTFVPDLATGLARAKAAAGDKYVNVLGADLARQLARSGDLDEVLTLIAPVLLGDGTPLFHEPGGRKVKLERIHQSAAPMATNLWYRVV